jgi:hypothetical protein
MLANPLKLRRITSPRMLQGALPGCDSPRMLPLAPCIPSRIVLHSSARYKPIDRTARPAVVNKTPIESRKPTSVQPRAVKKASLLPSIFEVWMVRIVSARCSAVRFLCLNGPYLTRRATIGRLELPLGRGRLNPGPCRPLSCGGGT